MVRLWFLPYWRFIRDQSRGQGLVEYALVIALVALVVIAALAVLGTRVAVFYNTAANSIPT